MEESDLMMRTLYGPFAVRVPMWMVVQDSGDAGVLFVGVSRDQRLRFGGTDPHQLVVGEFIARPHLVVESAHFAGNGLTAFVRNPASLDEWAQRGRVLCNPLGWFPKEASS